MKIEGNLLVLNAMDRLYIEWCVIPLNMSISVLWKGLYFAVQIKAFKIEHGSTKIYSIYYNGKQYAYKWTNYKWMMGHHGDYFPEIKTLTHTLKFQTGQNFFEIIDVPYESSNQNQAVDNSFIVFYQS